MMRRLLWIAFALLAVVAAVLSQRPRTQMVGPAADGSFVLNTGWRIRPAGTDIPLSTLPMSQVLSPDGRMLAVLNGGYAAPSVSLLDMETSREVSRATIGDGWRGLAFSPEGDTLWAG